MYSGQKVQDLPLEEISSDRRNPILADVMAQLDYMEKRGSGLRRICNETLALNGYRDELKPVFKSTISQFMTIVYSVGYDNKEQSVTKQSLSSHPVGTKSGVTWDQDGTKLGLSWDEVEKLFVALQNPCPMSELKDLYGWKNTTKFKDKYISPLIIENLVRMTIPDKPTSPNQRYCLTDFGKTIHESRKNPLSER